MVKHYIFKFYENFNLESFDNKLLNIFTECELTDTKIKVTFDLSKIGLGSVYKLLSVKSILEQYRELADKYLISSTLVVPNQTTRFLVSNIVPLLKPVSKVNYSVL